MSRITGEGRAEFLKTWRPGFDQEGAGRGGGQLNLCVETINPSTGINLTVLERMHQFTSKVLVYVIFVVSVCAPVENLENRTLLCY